MYFPPQRRRECGGPPWARGSAGRGHSGLLRLRVPPPPNPTVPAVPPWTAGRGGRGLLAGGAGWGAGPSARVGTKAGGVASPLRAFGVEGRLGSGTPSLRGRGQRDEGHVPGASRAPGPPPPTRAPGPQAWDCSAVSSTRNTHASLRFLPRPPNHKSRTWWSCPERRLLLNRAPGVAWASASSSSPGAALPPPALPLLPREGPGSGSQWQPVLIQFRVTPKMGSPLC